MAKLEAASLHTFFPLVSKYTKFAITLDGEYPKLQNDPASLLLV